MAKTATKAAAKPAPAPTKKPAATPARTASTASKPTEKAPEPEKQHSVPAVKTTAPPPSAETLANLPDFMRGDVDKGKEQIGTGDMEIPRLKLMQGPSKELQLYDDLKPGHFFHAAAEMIFDEPFKVVPLLFERQYILWNPLEAGGGIIARARDGVHWEPAQGEKTTKLDRKDGGHEVTWRWKGTVEQSGLANWGTMNPADPNSPPAATLMYNFLLAFPDYPDLMPAVLTFQRASIKIGRKFMTKLKTVRTPLFGSVFTLSSFDDHNAASQDFKNINITSSGLVMDRDMYEQYKSIHEALSKTGLNIKDIDSMQDDADAQGAGDGGDGKPAY